MEKECGAGGGRTLRPQLFDSNPEVTSCPGLPGDHRPHRRAAAPPCGQKLLARFSVLLMGSLSLSTPGVCPETRGDRSARRRLTVSFAR